MLPPSVVAICNRREFRYYPYKPSTKQLALLMSPTRETFYGGAAGPGKTSALLMRALLYTDLPGYNAAIFRETYPQLSGANGIIQRSQEWLANKGPQWNGSERVWTFPSGAKLLFGHVQHDKDVYNYQGHEWAFLGIDELTAWTEWKFKYLLSRVRRNLTDPFPLGVAATANPGGVGHGWTKARYIEPETRARGITVIRGVMSDNPGLDTDEYRKTLSSLPRVLREQLENGNWDVTGDGAIWKREWLHIVEKLADPRSSRIRFWDMAATADDGCYTVGVLMAREQSTGRFVTENVVRGRWAPGERDQVILQTARLDGPGVVVGWEEEPGSAGKTVTVYMTRMLAGFRLYAHRPTGPKPVRWGPHASQAEGGTVAVVAGRWTGEYLDELCSATLEETPPVDQCDATAGAFLWLAMNQMPEFRASSPLELPTVPDFAEGMMMNSPY